MRKVVKNSVITVKAMKRHPQMILTESGRNYYIQPDLYTNCVKFAEWYYWILKRNNNKFIVLKVIPTCLEQVLNNL